MLRMTEIEFAEFTASHPNAVPAKRKPSEKKKLISEESTDGAFSDEGKKKKAPKYLNHKVYVYQNGTIRFYAIGAVGLGMILYERIVGRKLRNYLKKICKSLRMK